MGNVNIKIIQDTRYKTADSVYPVRLRVTFDRAQHYYPTGIAMTVKEFAKMMGGSPGEDLRAKLRKLRKIETKAADLTEKASSFNYKLFKATMDGKEKTGSVKEHFDEYIAELKKNGKIKTKRNYESALKSFETFKEGWLLKDVTAKELRKYSDWMLSEGEDKISKTPTTISMYTRCMRTIINNAIASDEFTAKYPFGKHGFSIPAPRSKKNPLTTQEFNGLAAYKTKDPEKIYGRDMWLLCYYCGGRNYADILHLKYKDVSEDTITFHARQKTITTHENQKPLVVPIHDDLKEILNRHAQKNTGPETYVLPVLKSGKAEQLVNLRSDFGKRCNTSLALVSADLKVKAIKMQQSRHTALNELKRQNRTKEEIRVIAGHASDKTTELYLESMDDATVNEVLNSLRPKKLKAV